MTKCIQTMQEALSLQKSMTGENKLHKVLLKIQTY